MSIILQPDDCNKLADDMALCYRAAEELNKHYPGHLWSTHLDENGGMMYIRNLAVSFRYGYKLKLSRVYADPDLKCVMRAGGEILERARMARGWWDGQDATYVEGIAPKEQPINGYII